MLAILLLVGGLNACALWGPASDSQPLDESQRLERIEALHEAIDVEHARLEELITAADSQDGDPLREHPEIRDIAARLDVHRIELFELESRPLESQR